MFYGFFFIDFKLNKQTNCGKKAETNWRKNGKSSAINDTYPHRNMKSIFFLHRAFEAKRQKYRVQRTLRYNVNKINGMAWHGMAQMQGNKNNFLHRQQ